MQPTYSRDYNHESLDVSFQAHASGLSVGHIAVSPIDCMIKVLWVDPSHRGQGIGRRLVHMGEKELEREGCRGIALFAVAIDRCREPAPWEFWKHLGYRRAGPWTCIRAGLPISASFRARPYFKLI